MDFSNVAMSFNGPRLVLRTLKPEDASQAYVDWLNDPNVNRFLATKSATIESVRIYIKERAAQKDCLFFGMFIKETGQHIGTIKLEPIKKDRATIALMIGEKNAQGKGYGPEAMRILIQYCFDSLKLKVVDLGVIADNLGAIRAYEKVGFKETKRALKSIQYGDTLHDHLTMEVAPTTFQNHS